MENPTDVAEAPVVAIPANTVTIQDLVVWSEMAEQLKKLKAAEMLLRKRIFDAYFPGPKEGTNSAPLANNYLLKGNYPITRDIDLGSLGALKEQLAAAGIRVDVLVEYKPSLLTAEYRTLTAEQATLFDQCLIIKPGSPSLEIVLPAKAKKAGAQA